MASLTVKSSAFEHNKSIPSKYTCDGEDISPPLTVEGIPKDAKSLALIVDDPDAPMGTFDHWLMWNIPPTGTIAENAVAGAQGLNSDKQASYMGPCPPSGTHRYFFKVYALDTQLNLDAKVTTKADLEKAMQGHILAQGELMGLYSRSK
ncbi:MAG: YbhB/YbcL family Raf kinase inhibitor-like protein [Candidatus Bathyarchaeota archaeon]|nr:YbhB/YbcL family Raf kinase inhibitor-like protein [Candidatus Bathyarchaeota archaeon]